MKTPIQKQLEGKRILFATVPADGHVNPLTGLAKYLIEIGCDVRWYTSPTFAKKMEKLDIPFYPFLKAIDINTNNLEEMLPERANILDAGQKLDFDLLNVFSKRGAEYFQDIKDIHNLFPFDLMIADCMFTGIPFVKSNMNIPVIAIGIVPLSANSIDLAPYGMGLPPAQNDAEKSAFKDLYDLINNVVFKTSISYFSEVLDQHHILNEKSLLFDLLIKQSDLYLQIGVPSFEYERSDVANNIRFIGGLSPYFPSKTNNASWYDERLDAYNKVIVLTQGTVERDSEKLLKPALEAFKGTNILVIATTGGFDTAKLKEQYPEENIIIEDFIPFNEVMPYADIYITNGGYSGTILAIKNNLPMIAAGVHEGKNEICARIGYFKLGINLSTETPSPSALFEAAEEIFANKIYKENVSNLNAELKLLNPEELCTNYISQVLTDAEIQVIF
jgi:MGT family glycosyltransferase